MTKAQELADQISRDIRSGDLISPDRLPPGSLPSQDALAVRYKCGKSAVARAFVILKEARIIYATHAGTFPGPRATGGKWVYTCHYCPAVLEAPGTLTFVAVRKILRELGWGFRGSARGFTYFCPVHSPWGD